MCRAAGRERGSDRQPAGPSGRSAPTSIPPGWKSLRVTRERLHLFDTTLRDGQQSQGVDFSVEDKLTIARALDALGIDYVEGGWPGANPTDSAFFRGAAAARAGAADGVRDDQALGPLGLERRGAGRGGGRRHAGGLPRRQDPRLPCRDRARRQPRGEPREHRHSIRYLVGQGPRGALRRRALLRRLEGEPRLRARLPAGGARRRRPLGRALRHQRRHAAGRGRRDHPRGDRGRHPGRPARHPHPRRHRQRGREHARRDRRRRAPGAGHAERPR